MNVMPSTHHRRALLRWLARGSVAAVAASAASVLPGCSRWYAEPLRIGAQPWPGYEFLYMARELNLLDTALVHLIETPSASANLRGLATRSIDGACLTLDEVLTARANGVDLTLVAVLDESRGADALIAQAAYTSMAQLRGQTIGVEQTAVGAVLLNAALESAGLTVRDVQTRFIAVDNHVSAFQSGQVDAVVTYEPHKSKLLASRGHLVFSSATTPGLILDTVAVRTELLTQKQQQIKVMLSAHFQAYQRWRVSPDQHNALLGSRLDLAPDEVGPIFQEIYFPSAQENREWMTNSPAKLHVVAEKLSAIMLRQGLLPNAPSLDRLFSSDFLP